MPANLITKTDTNKQTFPKINQAIQDAFDAVTKATSANQNSNEAIVKAKSVQNQLDTLIIESGTSDAETLQARTKADGSTSKTLKERLDNDHNLVVQELNKKAAQTAVTELNSKVAEINKIVSGITFNSLPEPIIFAHRAAKNIFPESSIEGYRGCVNMGLNVLEMDVRETADGALIVHHDDTMERTTDKTGSVDYYSSMGFKSAKIDALPGWSGTPVLFEDLLREFGNKVIYAPELKGSGLSEKVADVIIKHNLQNNVIIQSFSAPDLTYAMSKGIPVCYLKSKEDVTPQTILSWGIKHVGLSTSLSDSYVTDCIRAGLKVYLYTVNRRYDYKRYRSLGVHGVFSDDPLWVTSQSPVLEWDPFRDQVFTHGHFSPEAVSDYTGGNRGGFTAPTKFGWKTASEKSDFSLQGWAGELASNFTVQLKMTFVESVSGVRWGSVAFCTKNDYFDDYSSGLSDGYHLLLRENGELELYIRNNGPASELGTLTTAAITQGQTVTIKIEVTNSSIIATRVDTNQSITVNNNVFRKGYLHFGRRYTGVMFENVQVVRKS